MDLLGKKEDGRLVVGQREPASQVHDGQGTVVQRHRWTEDEIRGMGAQEYGERLRTDPNFASAIDEYFAPKAPVSEPPQS